MLQSQRQAKRIVIFVKLNILVFRHGNHAQIPLPKPCQANASSSSFVYCCWCRIQFYISSLSSLCPFCAHELNSLNPLRRLSLLLTLSPSLSPSPCLSIPFGIISAKLTFCIFSPPSHPVFAVVWRRRRRIQCQTTASNPERVRNYCCYIICTERANEGTSFACALPNNGNKQWKYCSKINTLPLFQCSRFIQCNGVRSWNAWWRSWHRRMVCIAVDPNRWLLTNFIMLL